MRVLSRVAHLALTRLEVEHMDHGGAENGRLPTTYQQFEEWGIHPRFVASALRELQALGIVEITRHGYAGAADKRSPSLYRLTYLTAHDAGSADATGTHEYLKIKTVEEAEAVAKAARNAADPRNVERSKKHSATVTKCQISPSQSDGTKAKRRRHKVTVQVTVTKWGYYLYLGIYLLRLASRPPLSPMCPSQQSKRRAGRRAPDLRRPRATNLCRPLSRPSAALRLSLAGASR